MDKLLTAAQIEAALNDGYVFVDYCSKGIHEMVRCDVIQGCTDVHGHATSAALIKHNLCRTRVRQPGCCDSFVYHRADHPGVKHWEISMHWTNRPNDPIDVESDS